MKLKIKDLYKSFDNKVEVLKGINVEQDVSTLAIIGPSGCGKSTILKIIGGLLDFEAGEIIVDDLQLGHTEKELHQYRKNIGFVFQQSGLFKQLKVLDNIALPLKVVHGYTKEAAKERAMELLTRFGLKDSAQKMPAMLSGGEKQRVAIVRAIAPKPKILLLDEPTSALDPEYTNEVLDVLSELENSGVKFIIVTHEMGFARYACRDVMFMNDGKIIESGKSEDLFTNPKTEELKKFLSKLLEWKV